MGDLTLKAFVRRRIIEQYQTLAQTICLDSWFAFEIKHNVYQEFLVHTLSRRCQTKVLEEFSKVFNIVQLPLKHKRGIEGCYLEEGEFPPLEPYHGGLELH